MQKKIFITQEKLDELSAGEKIVIEGNEMTVLSQQNSVYTLTPAVKFMAIESQPEDPHGLIGKILPQNITDEKGIEIYMDSAIFQDEAYKVIQGFTGELKEAGAAPPVEEKPAEAEKAEPHENKEKSDDELLADFLLKNL